MQRNCRKTILSHYQISYEECVERMPEGMSEAIVEKLEVRILFEIALQNSKKLAK